MAAEKLRTATNKQLIATTKQLITTNGRSLINDRLKNTFHDISHTLLVTEDISQANKSLIKLIKSLLNLMKSYLTIKYYKEHYKVL